VCCKSLLVTRGADIIVSLRVRADVVNRRLLTDITERVVARAPTRPSEPVPVRAEQDTRAAW